MQSSNAGKRRGIGKGEKFSERQILVIQLMGEEGLEPCVSSKMAQRAKLCSWGERGC